MVRTHVSEWTPSERETDCRQHLLPAEAECTSILWDRDNGWKKRGGKVWSECFAKYFTQRESYLLKWAADSADGYLPSWVPIHTVPAVSPDITRPERLCQKERLSKQRCFPDVSSKLSVWHEGIIQVQNTLDKLSVGSCCSPLYWHWPMGGTAQMQRAGAVGGRLNWSSTVLGRAGSITVISLQEAGPETTHTEHWQRGTDMEFEKMSGMKQLVPGKC